MHLVEVADELTRYGHFSEDAAFAPLQCFKNNGAVRYVDALRRESKDFGDARSTERENGTKGAGLSS